MTVKNEINYFVDESGDGALFDAKGRALSEIGSTPQNFILGMIHLEQPARVERELTALRKALLADSYFSGVPSFQPSARKTALFFHAKDDLPEVRREVFRLLHGIDFKFFAVIKNMNSVLAYVRSRNSMDATYRYRPDDLYDLTVRMLFKTRLHKEEAYRVVFAKRGQKNRTEALEMQLQLTRERFFRQLGRDAAETTLEVFPAYPWQVAGLQVVDYCLWALQRLFERGEDRYMQLIAEKISFIHDVDDRRQNQYGSYYHKKNPLTIEVIKNRQV